jgi:3-phenylpropionate/cinnamic acid dioxygenase small subunit
MNRSAFLEPVPEALRQEFVEGCETIEREAILLDERRWDEWLDVFSDDVQYWAPTWRGDGTLSSDPMLELSHIFYNNRRALEDRVARFTSRMSPASNPPPRTTHLLSGFRLLEGSASGRLHIRSSWVTHVFFPQRKASHALFGSRYETVVRRDKGWLIEAKTIVIKNDYIPTMLDVYCL